MYMCMNPADSSWALLSRVPISHPGRTLPKVGLIDRRLVQRSLYVGRPVARGIIQPVGYQSDPAEHTTRRPGQHTRT